MYATFDCIVSIVDEKLRDKIGREIYERRKAEVGGHTADLLADDSDDEDLIGYDAIEPGLPPASSDRQKWWLENGRMPRSSVTPPKPDNPAFQTILNPKRPTNPYAPTEEPDWVNVPRSESRLSSFSSMSTSPYEHVNHSMLLSASASSSAPRKLPPPFDASALPAKVGRLHIGEDSRNQQTDGPPPPPPPRRQTTMTSSVPAPASTVATSNPIPIRKPVNRTIPAPPVRSTTTATQPVHKQKAPPPVAKKPAHLTAPGSPVSISSMSSFSDKTSMTQNTAGRQTSQTLSKQGPAATPSGTTPSNQLSANGHNAQKDGLPPPKPPRRNEADRAVNVSGRSTPGGAIGLVGLVDHERQPPQLPNRKPVALAQKPTTQPPMPRKSQIAVDLLGDEKGGIEMGGWEALKPT